MKIFDFNIHLAKLNSEDAGELVQAENRMLDQDLADSFNVYSDTLSERLAGGNFMLFNQDIFAEPDSIKNFDSNVSRVFPSHSYTMLFNFRRKDFRDMIDGAFEQGVRGIKFHSYNQNIRNEDFPAVCEVCRYAEKKNLYICIDTSFGTRKMYDCDNLHLAAYLSEHINHSPIILLHSGGARIFEAMLLAEDAQNIYLENSFSPIYYAGSSIEADFYFAYKKAGAEKILFGSDFPYVQLDESIDKTLDSLQKTGFSSREIEMIMFENAMGITQHC